MAARGSQARTTGGCISAWAMRARSSASRSTGRRARSRRSITFSWIDSMSSPSLAEQRGAANGVWARLGALDPRYLISFLITLVLIVGEARYGILGGYARLVITLSVCTVTELVLSRLVRGRFVNIQSAYITGISLALLIKPRADLLWPFALGSFLAIASKYVLQVRGQHLWNPSNFAISLLVLLAPASVAILSHQWGNDLATNAVIWCFGLLIASRVRMLHVTLTYVACFVALALVRSSIVGGPLLAEIAPLTGPMYQLCIFFMITDPKTTGSTVRG